MNTRSINLNKSIIIPVCTPAVLSTLVHAKLHTLKSYWTEAFLDDCKRIQLEDTIINHDEVREVKVV